jgi:hypothetical protein
MLHSSFQYEWLCKFGAGEAERMWNWWWHAVRPHQRVNTTLPLMSVCVWNELDGPHIKQTHTHGYTHTTTHHHTHTQTGGHILAFRKNARIALNKKTWKCTDHTAGCLVDSYFSKVHTLLDPNYSLTLPWKLYRVVQTPLRSLPWTCWGRHTWKAHPHMTMRS